MMTARKLALSVLLRCEKDAGYSSLTLDTALKRNPLNDADRALASNLVFGVISHKITLDHYISKLSSMPIEKLESEILCILRMGIYQIFFLDRIPPHAAVNESVRLTPKRAAGFVNALLRNALRKKDSLSLPEGSSAEALSVRYSVPVKLCELLIAEYGSDIEKILEAYNNIPNLTLRVNTLKTDRDSLLDIFAKNGIVAEKGAYSPYALTLHGGSPTQLPGFDERLFFVQDEASQLCCAATGVKPGDKFMDCCSAPGSKSFGAAMQMQDQGYILSCDLHENKLSLIRSGAESLGISVIETKQADGRVFIEELEGKFDSVLCDVPCSGFGVVSKKPEIRYKSLDDVSRLPQIQRNILENCCSYVKDGGILVYSTCTVLSAENTAVTDDFIKHHPEFSYEGFELDGKEYPSPLSLTPSAQTDGFYITRMRKKTNNGG